MSKKREIKSGEQRYCPACGARRDTDDRFCRKCGAPLTGEAKPNGKMRGLTGLRAFGLAVLALAIVYAFLLYGNRVSDSQPSPQSIPISAVGGQPAAQPAAQPLTARAAADQLFNQAMTAHETGDLASAQRFIPMAISAYQGLASLDLDARYHLALLGLAAGRPQDALAQADTMFGEVPEHLLALSVSARAYETLGNEAAAAQFWQRFLTAYTPDIAASRPEYMDHARALPARRDWAEQYLRERGLR
ncbi:MAG: zinc-ribbon domain-containing protein [Gemmatimonadota bacterium]|nr:MAG: zinc-ribbon domain-containing protein [Gemmatimonadota bacterium]